MDEEQIDDEIENIESLIANINDDPIYCEEDFIRKENELKIIKRKIQKAINELEVLDFLENGPGGIDP